jgi:hypothetical protein
MDFADDEPDRGKGARIRGLKYGQHRLGAKGTDQEKGRRIGRTPEKGAMRHAIPEKKSPAKWAERGRLAPERLQCGFAPQSCLLSEEVTASRLALTFAGNGAEHAALGAVPCEFREKAFDGVEPGCPRWEEIGRTSADDWRAILVPRESYG